jgi:hypothetical protein
VVLEEQLLLGLASCEHGSLPSGRGEANPLSATGGLIERVRQT